MSCPDCDAMRHEIDRLMGREAYSIPAVHAIKRKFRITPAEARIVHKLFLAKGNLVSDDSLELVASKHPYEIGSNLIRVYIYRIRGALGVDAIETMHNKGYCLTQTGQKLVASALETLGATA